MKSKTLVRTMLALAAGAAGVIPCAEGARAQEPGDVPAIRVAGDPPMIGISHFAADGGVRVVGLLRDGPAAEAGIRLGDVIVSINGLNLAEPIEGEDDRVSPAGHSGPQARLLWLIRDVPEGESVEVTVDRDGEPMSFTVVPEFAPPATFHDPANYDYEYPDLSVNLDSALDLASMVRMGTLRVGSPLTRFNLTRVPSRVDFELRDRMDSLIEFRLNPAVRVLDFNDGWSGRFENFGSNRVEVVQLNPELGAYFGTEDGVLVLDVDGESTLGLRPGDVVVRIGGRQVSDVSDMRRILFSYEDDEKVDFGIWRDGAEATVVGTIR